MWYLALTKSRQESRAKENLENQGIETFLPFFYKEVLKKGQRCTQSEPLFPGYIFINLAADNPLLGKVRSTYGVRKLLTFGLEPVVVQDALIADLQQRYVNPETAAQFTSGQEVQVMSGPFKHYQAIFKEYQGSERAIILVSLLGQQNELLMELKGLSS